MTKTPVTAASAAFVFYDIEALSDAFTLAAFDVRHNGVELFCLIEPGTALEADVRSVGAGLEALIAERVFQKNPAFKPAPGRPNPQVVLHDLGTLKGCVRLASLFGMFDGSDVCAPSDDDTFGGGFRLVTDVEDEYDPFAAHPYFAGYNSYEYDTTMLALFLMESFATLRSDRLSVQTDPGRTLEGFRPTRPSIMRRHNDRLFSAEHHGFMPSYLIEGEASGGEGWNSLPSRLRKGMLDTGRHIDVARLNESQRFVGLKRQLGGLGRQILESDGLSHDAPVRTVSELADLLAYNVSDVVGLSHLFAHPAYASAFDLKKGLLDEYPETVFDKGHQSGRVHIARDNVRMGRLTPDSTSAKFVGRILAPYKHLDDIEAVSFLYPSQRIVDEAAARGEIIERRNVLDDCIAFFESVVPTDTDAGRAAHAQFAQVVAYYRDIEGTSFNESDEYQRAWPNTRVRQLQSLRQIPKLPNNVPYFRADGTPTTCFATFSTGGIHGAEYDEDAYRDAAAQIVDFNEMMRQVRMAYPDPLGFWEEHPGKKTFVLADGREVSRSEVLVGGTTLKKLRERAEALTEAAANGADEQMLAELRDSFGKIGYREDKPLPELFERNADGSTKLKAKFVRTSCEQAIHEDFTSYYPNMLRNMSAFYNPDLGEDRYAKIFEDKERYGREMKRPGISAEEKARLGVLRNGTKLILNSASGAGDTTHKTPIRMNNTIISMRIIGQLFSWRVGQAQAFEGARIISTNTDGLYSVLDEATNNRVLEEQSSIIRVDIEPETLFVISKDSNNRLELAVKPGTPLWDAPFISASGGTLACHEGPQPTKSLAHPAVVDWALARYLRYAAGGSVSLDEPLNRTAAMWLMQQARDQQDTLLATRLFQNVLAASSGKITFPFATDIATGAHRALGHYTRVFVVKEGTADAVNLQAAGSWVVNAASRAVREREGQPLAVRYDAVATPILLANGYSVDGRGGTHVLPAEQDIAVRKISGIEADWPMLVDNRDLVELGDAERYEQILSKLDLDIYVEILASTYESNWMNTAVRGESAGEDETPVSEEEMDSVPEAA